MLCCVELLPTRLCAKAMALCLSQVGVLLKPLDRPSCFLALRLLLTYLTLCFKEI